MRGGDSRSGSCQAVLLQARQLLRKSMFHRFFSSHSFGVLVVQTGTPPLSYDATSFSTHKEAFCFNIYLQRGLFAEHCLLYTNDSSLSHLTLFVLRMIAIFRSRFWTRPSPWRLSTGQYTLGVEFTFKVLRQGGEGESSV